MSTTDIHNTKPYITTIKLYNQNPFVEHICAR